MTTIQINLPDELALDARQAGLLTPESIEAMLRAQLKKQSGDSLRAMWNRGPKDEPTAEQEQSIDEAVQAARSEQRKRMAS
jgi:hypothetical protein